MTENTTNNTTDFNFNALIREQQIRFPYSDNSNWDYVTLYVSRKYNWTSDDKEAGTWEFEISTSSMRTEDAEQARRFARAMEEAAITAESLRRRVDQLEAAWQEKRAAERAEYEAEKAARQAAYDADAPMSKLTAEALMATLAAATEGGKEATATLLERGTRAQTTVGAYQTRSGIVKYTRRGTVVGKKVVLQTLTEGVSAESEPEINTAWNRR
jgi:hypothetical protein